MQMNSTSRPCSTRHEIIKTIPTLRLQLQTNFILRATLSGVPRGRPSVRVVVTTTAAPIYCVHSLSLCNAQTGGEFSSTENLVLPKKKVQKNRDNNTTTNATEGSGGDGSRLSGNGFFCAPTGPKRAGPLLPSSSSSSSPTGRMGEPNEKNYKHNISVQRTRTERNVMQPSAKDEGLWQFDEIPPIRLHFHLVLLSLQRHNVRVFRKFS